MVYDIKRIEYEKSNQFRFNYLVFLSFSLHCAKKNVERLKLFVFFITLRKKKSVERLKLGFVYRILLKKDLFTESYSKRICLQNPI